MEPSQEKPPTDCTPRVRREADLDTPRPWCEPTSQPSEDEKRYARRRGSLVELHARDCRITVITAHRTRGQQKVVLQLRRTATAVRQKLAARHNKHQLDGVQRTRAYQRSHCFIQTWCNRGPARPRRRNEECLRHESLPHQQRLPPAKRMRRSWLEAH